MNNSEETSFVDKIYVDMGECVTLDGESRQYLETDGLGPCVGVAIVIETFDRGVHRLLGHIVMEERPRTSFEELKACSEKIKTYTKDNAKNIEITLVTTQSFRNRTSFTEEEKDLFRMILNEFGDEYGVVFRDIKFKYSSQVQVSPDGLISTDFQNKHRIAQER